MVFFRDGRVYYAPADRTLVEMVTELGDIEFARALHEAGAVPGTSRNNGEMEKRGQPGDYRNWPNATSTYNDGLVKWSGDRGEWYEYIPERGNRYNLCFVISGITPDYSECLRELQAFMPQTELVTNTVVVGLIPPDDILRQTTGPCRTDYMDFIQYLVERYADRTGRPSTDALFLGFGRGAEIAQEFSMLYPKTVSRLKLCSPDYLFMPDQEILWPYGAKGMPHPEYLEGFADRATHVWVGGWDDLATTLRGDQQKENRRIARAYAWKVSARDYAYAVQSKRKSYHEVGIQVQYLPGESRSYYWRFEENPPKDVPNGRPRVIWPGLAVNEEDGENGKRELKVVF